MNKRILVIGFGAAGVLAAGAAMAHPSGKFRGVAPEALLERMDVNGDGVISVDEIETRAKERAEKLDANSDGIISADEIATHREERRQKRRERRFPDKNEDGVVDRVEFNAAASERFDRLDVNGDGVLSDDEVFDHRRSKGRRR